MNKLNYKRNIFLVSFIIGISLLLMTCDPGLGKAVDTQAPKVAIELPVTKSVLKGGFTMKGIATDEIRVAECFVTFKNIKTSQSYKYMAAVANGEFTVSINDPKADGSFELPDGDYNVTVTVSDAYRNSTADVVYTIDNTAPTVLITSPNSYSVSNWPNMYKNFNIKGEVYDSSTLESVTVYLVDEQGKILTSVIADGTNTFLASFETPFEEEKICFYYAVAKDAGGNENTYCYHKSDIFQLISEEKNGNAVEQRTETNIVFPSINTIGYVDQGNSGEILIGSIGKEKLIAKKIENTSLKVVEGKYVFPGFNYYKENASQIKWLNISNDVSQIAGIGIGAPVLGTIMPPTDGSAIKYESVYVWVSRVGKEFKDVEEFKTPEEFKQYLNESMFTEANKLESCVISEGEKGNKQVKLTAVGESLNFQVDSSKPGEEENNWVSGYYYIKVQFTTESGVTTSDYCKFEVTAGAPVLTEGLFAKGKEKASYYRGYTTANTIEEGLGGIALTSDLSSPVKVDWYYSGITTTGKEVSSKVETISPEDDGTYVIPIKHEEDGEYTYTLTAASDTDLSTVISRVVVVDATAPVVEFSNISEGEILETSEYTVKGNIDDANGIEKVEWKLQENGTGGTWQEISKAKASFQQELSKLKENVEYTIKIRATDVAGNVSGEESYKCKFTIDVANPVASIDSPKPEENTSIVFVKDIPVFSGKASDAAVTTGKKASSASLSYRKDGGTEVAVPTGTTTGQFNWDQNSGSWSWNPTTSQFNGTGKYDVTIKVTDNAGKTTSESRTVSLDTIVPTIKLTQVNPYVDREKVEEGYYVNGEITVKFDITENDYIREIKWYKPDGSEDSQDLGTNAQPTVKISTIAFADGTKLGAFKLVVTDRSGNEGVYTGGELSKYEINQDTDKPTIDISGIDLSVTAEEGITADKNLFSASDVVTITFKDDDGVLEGSYQVDENSEKTISGGNAKLKTETVSLNGLGQGVHTIKLTVKDSNGKKVETEKIYFGIDDKAPELIINGYSDTEIEAGFKNADFEVTGNVSDSYELRSLIYSYIDDQSSETQITANNDGRWTLPIGKPSTSEKKTIKFVASDKFLRTTVKTFTYVFDLDKPNLIITEAQKQSITNRYFNQNSMITLSGNANDVTGDSATQSGLKYVQYGLGEGSNAEKPNKIEYRNANGSSEWTVLLDIPQVTDGTYTLFVKAVDNSGNESEEQKFNIIADSISPILTVGGSREASGTTYASGALVLSGTVEDINFDKLIYTYTVDGVEKESNQKIDVLEDSSWEIEPREDLTDGIHVLKFVAYDKAGNSTVITRNIIVDQTAPEITTNVSPLVSYDNGNGVEPTVNGDIDVTIRVSETNKLSSVSYTFDNWGTKVFFKGDDLSIGKTIKIDTRDSKHVTDESKLSLIIEAIDEAGNPSEAKVDYVVNQESDKPTFSPTNFTITDEPGISETDNGNKSVNVFGVTNPNMIFTLGDDDAVASYSVSVDGGNTFGDSIAVGSTQQIINYSVADLGVGTYDIVFKVFDENYKDETSTQYNFEKTKTYKIAIDDGAPVLQIENEDGIYVGSSFTITGSVSDAIGIEQIVFKPENGGETVYGSISKEDIEDDKFTYTFDVTQAQEKKPILITAYDSIGNSTTRKLTYKVDTVKPTVTISEENTVNVGGVNKFYVNGDLATLRLNGEYADGSKNNGDTDVSGVEQVLLRIEGDESSVTEAKREAGSWTGTLDFTGKPQEEYTVYAKSIDKAGNVSEEVSVKVYVDTYLPSLTITTPHEEANGILNLGIKNTGFSIAGTATDEGGLESVTAKIQGSSENLEGSFEEGMWSFDIPSETNDGQLTILVTAKDKCGKTSQATLTAVLDKTKPEITFSNLEAGKILPRKTYTVNGSVSDVNGIAKVEYQLVTDGVATNWVEVAGASTSFNVELSNLEINKNYTLKLRATDNAVNITGDEEYTRTFTLNSDKPNIVTSYTPVVSNGQETSVNGTINVKVSASDTNAIVSAWYTYDEGLSEESDWATSGKAISITAEEISKGKEIEVDTTDYDKANLPLRIKVVDEAENYSVSSVSPYVNQELDKPSITPSNFQKLGALEEAGWDVSGATNVFPLGGQNMIFTVSDDDSVKSCFVKVDDRAYSKVGEDVNSAQKTILYPVSGLEYGRHTITIKVEDEYGKSVEEIYYIAMDDGEPKLTLGSTNNQFVGESFDITGTVEDLNGIDSIEIYSESDKLYASTTKGDFTLGDDGRFSYKFSVPEEKEKIVIIATDEVGNKSNVNLTYQVDSTSPSLTVINGANAFVDGDTPTLRVSGTASDKERGSKDTGISGIDQVRIKIGSPITGKNDADSYLAVGKVVEGEMDWSYNLDFNDYDAGTYRVYIQAFDIAGNVSNEETIIVYVDRDAPKLSHGYTDNFVGVYKGDFVIQGTATDASGVKSVTAKIQGASGNLTGSFEETSNGSSASWRFTIPGNSGDGQKTILVTAKDGCGKTVQETFTATLDTAVPTVTFTDISDDDVNDDGANNTTIETSKTTDKPSVSVTYSDITSGVKTIDYSFYYFDKTKGTFVNYATEDPNATGTFDRKSSFSGSVKLRMAEQTTTTSGPFIYSDTYTDGKWYVKVTVTDEAGNFETYDSPYFYVDQHKPTLDVVSPVDLSLKKENDSLTVKGTTTDNFNGEIDRVVVKVTHPNYNSSQLEQFTKIFTKDGSNGTQLTQIGSGEKYSFEYTWDEANSPFKFPNEYEIIITTYDVAGNEVSLPKKVSCDKTAPTISFTRPYSYSVDSYGKVTVGTVVNSPIGDTSIKALASDHSMENIYYQIGGTVTIDADGTLGQNDYKINTLTVTDGGVGSDIHGTSVEDVKFDDVHVVLKGKWNKLTNANLDFDVTYNTLNFNNNKMTYHVDGDKETIMTLDVHLVAVDKAGNINYCKMPIKVDTDTDKPNLLVLSPKTINDVANVGGTATVSGTVNDDNGVHSVLMQVELVNGNYNGNILEGFGINYSQGSYGMTNPQVLVENNDGTYSLDYNTSYFADKTKWYKVNLGAQNSKSTTWNLVLNKNKEFDNSSLWTNGYLTKEVEQTELKIRVRALDTKSGNSNISTDAKLGDISEFTLKIDSGSPSIVINNIADFPTEGSYIGGTLNFDIDFSDDEKITEWAIEAFSTASGDNRTKVIASGKYAGDYKDGISQTVHVEESVNTEDIYRECGNVIQIKISAKDNSTSGDGNTETPKESSLTFKYIIDNSAPQANNVATIDGNSYLIDTETVNGDSGSHRETEIRGNHLRIMSDQAAFKGSVFDEANGSGVDYVMLYFTKGEDLYNPSKEKTIEPSYEISVDGEDIKFPVASLNDVVRTSSANGGKPTPYIVVDRAEGMIDSGANGDLDGYDENLKANGEWVVYIKSSNLPDGIYKIHYVVVDHAKNVRYYQDSMLVQNHAPKITSIVLATDINGDGTVDISADGTSDEDKKFDTSMGFKGTGFNVRNSKLKIKVNVTGGKEPLKYFLRYKTTSGEVTTDKNDPGYETGEFEVTSFLGDSSTSVDYVVWVEDTVEEKLSLSSGETVIDMIMDNVDDISPVAQFFELNTTVESANSNRGSLYKDPNSNKIQGHIEPRQNSPVDNTSLKDPDVSGTIILRGEALDNQRIASIVLNLNGTNVTIAEWDSETKQLLGKNNAVVVDDLGLNGHYVEWSYAWDTNAIIKYDVPVVVSVKDSKGNTNTTTVFASGTNDNKPRTNGDGGTVDNRFSSDGWGYNSMTVDAVPYITNVKRNSTYNTNRAKSGAIPLLREEWSNRIEGFNLGTDISQVSVELTENKDGTGNKTAISNIAKDGTTTTFQVPVSAKDGYLSTFVNEIRSINNINDNSQEYNRESNEYDAKTTYWTDDRFIRIWQNKSTDYFPESGNPIYPSMAIGNTGELYASFSNYSTASVYYARYQGSGRVAVFSIYDPPEETDICVTGEDKLNIAFAGNYHNGGSNSWGTDVDLSGGLYVYDSSSSAKRGNYTFNKHELYYHDEMLQQFKNMRIKRKNNTSSTLIHLVYFDRITSSVHYSNSPGNGTKGDGTNTKQGAKSSEYSWVNIDGSSDTDDSESYFDGSSNVLPNSVFTGTERCSGTGESIGLALTTSGFPNVVYFDASNKVLKIARATKENPKGGNNWIVQDITDDTSVLGVSVESISCEIDSTGKLHIAFQNGKNQLVYIKSKDSSANGQTNYTFEDPVVVAEGVSWVDLTLKGSTPYISYLSGANSYDGLNLAFFDKDIDTNFDGNGDGAWECMTAPLQFKATSIRTCVEVHPNPSNSSAWGEAAIGFTPGDFYRLALYIGSGKGH